MTEVCCPLCGLNLKAYKEHERPFDTYSYNCLNCGCFRLAGDAVEELKQFNDQPRAVISFAVWQAQSGESNPLLDKKWIENAVETTKLPKPPEQVDRLLLALGISYPQAGFEIFIPPGVYLAPIGATVQREYEFALDTLLTKGYCEAAHNGGFAITIDGWNRFETLLRAEQLSRRAFMAMPFGNSELDRVFTDCFEPAVEATGFELRRLDSEQRAGLIDDRLRVEIRTSRFMIAELTNDNLGAYWEAGFSEGLGRPVIYTCKKAFFVENKTHFDTNHHLTVLWDLSDLSEATEQLKATIRATLPAEAKMTE